ncbi:MAG TPA: tellurite resistance/C4-dicarboxylate transporter family protein [Pyrinomonadaceae bacterium]|nr:tellurite resistance/C4-dicarboxylate transporter family protein [Pyrinomonadaceae bacterium]
MSDAPPSNALSRAAADLFPGYFALVMATGIISIACFLLGMRTISLALLVIDIFAYVVLCVLLILRLLFFFSRVKADIGDHVRGPGFFTVVAGTCVLGSALLIVIDQHRPALVLWLAGIGLWLVIMYTFFTAVTVRESKPSIEAGLNGGWLLVVVATQSISVLGTLLVSRLVNYREPILFFTLCMFLLGCMLYLPLITLIFYRFTFVNVTLVALTPPYWINMGAVAITTLAGARLIIAAPGWSLLNELVPFLKGFSLFFWAAGTWWIPLLLALGFWRHVYKRFPLKYDPQYWGMVFPFGMYTVCTFQLSHAIDFPPLLAIPRYFIYLALAGWIAASAGLMGTLFQFKSMRRRSSL